jgi:hypothetical protein
MEQDTQAVMTFASISGKKVHADFDGGTVTSDGGVLFLRAIDAKLGVIQRFTQALRDRRHPSYVDHSYEELLRQRIFQIACGYEDANDCDALRRDPGFKAACNRLPLSGDPLGSQPTMTRLANAAQRTALYRMARALVDTFVASYKTPPKALILDIDDTDDPTHGEQQMTLFNAHYGEHCYLPLHIYEGQSGKLITTILRPGRRPSGKDIVAILKRLIPYLRKHWPKVLLSLRGDSHFSAPEVHDFCAQHDLYYVLGQSSTPVLKARAPGLLAQARKLYAHKCAQAPSETRPNKVRLLTSFVYQAQSWQRPLRIVCKVEVSDQGDNLRFVVTNLEQARCSLVYDSAYCHRGRMENCIKNHKTFLHSDRTSCHRFEANQFRLLLHSAAYVLMHALGQWGLKGTAWAQSQFNILQLRLLKVGAKVCEMATRVKVHYPTSYPLKEVYQKLMRNLAQAYP